MRTRSRFRTTMHRLVTAAVLIAVCHLSASAQIMTNMLVVNNPPSVGFDQLLSANGGVPILVPEATGVTLNSAINVNLAAPVITPPGIAGPPVLNRTVLQPTQGGVYDSYLLVYDVRQGAPDFGTGTSATGTFMSMTPIAALLWETAYLDGSDTIFQRPGTSYPNGKLSRGTLFGAGGTGDGNPATGAINEGPDAITWSTATPDTVTVMMDVSDTGSGSDRIDHVRILVETRQARESHWLATESGSWENDDNWSTGFYPDNGRVIGSSRYNVTIDDEQHVELSSFVDIEQITLTSRGELDIRAGGDLTINNGRISAAGPDGGSDGGNIRLMGATPTAAAHLHINGATLATGGGNIVFASNQQNLVSALDPANDILTMDGGFRIETAGPQTSGEIQTQLINNGAVVANGGNIEIDYVGNPAGANAIVNTGVLSAANGGTLTLEGANVRNADNGRLLADGDNSAIHLDSATTVTGGAIAGNGRVRVRDQGIRVNDVAVEEEARLLIDDQFQLTLGSDGLTNNGLLSVWSTSTGFPTRLSVDGDVTVDGSGTILIRGGGTGLIGPANSGNGAHSLTLGENQELRSEDLTNGLITTTLSNRGLVHAFGAGFTIDFRNMGGGALPFVFNNGELRATNAGTLIFDSLTVDNVGAGDELGFFTLDPTSRLRFRNSTLMGGAIFGQGLLTVDGVCRFDGSAGGIQSDATVRILSGSELGLVGDFTNDGRVEFRQFLGQRTSLSAMGDVTIDGIGQIVAAPGEVCVLTADDEGSFTLAGQQQFILPEDAICRLETDLNNNALIELHGAIELATQPGHSTPFSNLPGGTIFGDGAVVLDNATLVNHGILTPASGHQNLLGELRLVDGNLDQSPTGILEIEIRGTTPGVDFDRLVVDGTAALAGILDVSLLDDFIPEPGQQFNVLTASELILDDLTLGGADSALFDMVVGPGFLSLEFLGPSADFNGDGAIDELDYAIWRTNFGQSTETGSASGDANGDGRTDGGDFLALQRQINSAVEASSEVSAVPEPATLALLTIGFFGLHRGRRGRRFRCDSPR